MTAFDDKGKAWDAYQSELFRGWVPSEAVPEKITPGLTWCGGKMSLDVWREALAFLLWGFRRDGGENQGRFYYNTQTRAWAFVATPQWASTSLSTTEIPADHPQHGGLWAPIDLEFKPPWVSVGTIHTHAKAPAFQSGTDRHDESTQQGLHVTVGHCDKLELSVHARVVFKGGEYAADLGEWVQLPDVQLGGRPLVELLPAKLVEPIHRALLACPPPPTHPFPKDWEARVVAPETVWGAAAVWGATHSHRVVGDPSWRGGVAARLPVGPGVSTLGVAPNEVAPNEAAFIKALKEELDLMEWSDGTTLPATSVREDVLADPLTYWRHGGHPVERVMVRLALDHNLGPGQVRRLLEQMVTPVNVIPFGA